jgi:hypothetical protein
VRPLLEAGGPEGDILRLARDLANLRRKMVTLYAFSSRAHAGTQAVRNGWREQRDADTLAFALMNR